MLASGYFANAGHTPLPVRTIFITDATLNGHAHIIHASSIFGTVGARTIRYTPPVDAIGIGTTFSIVPTARRVVGTDLVFTNLSCGTVGVHGTPVNHHAETIVADGTRWTVCGLPTLRVFRHTNPILATTTCSAICILLARSRFTDTRATLLAHGTVAVVVTGLTRGLTPPTVTDGATWTI